MVKANKRHYSSISNIANKSMKIFPSTIGPIQLCISNITYCGIDYCPWYLLDNFLP